MLKDFILSITVNVSLVNLKSAGELDLLTVRITMVSDVSRQNAFKAHSKTKRNKIQRNLQITLKTYKDVTHTVMLFRAGTTSLQ